MYTSLQAQTAILDKFSAGRDTQLASRRYAWNLFEKAYSRGRRSRWLAGLTRKPVRLPCIPRITKAARHTTGTVVLPLTKIVGSEGRSQDFDKDFNPLNEHTRDRWIGIAAARARGVVLPAVELVQVGEQYYVRDGHHRISVARALGQLDIEARIVN
jgi:hypothetical protein